MNRRNRILSPLLSAVFILLFLAGTTQAALLKDIRIGDYQKFTRIVFELDSPVEPERIDIESSDQLTVVFPHTSVDFIRKIPVGRSHQVKNIQIWNQADRLSAIITLDFKSLRHESFFLNHPPRVVLDIQPQAQTQETTTGASATDQRGRGNHTAQAVVSDSGSSSSASEAPADSLPVNEAGQTENDASKNNDATITDVDQNPTPSPAIEAGGNQLRDEIVESQIDTRDSSHTAPVKRSNRLQFYLVVVLVLITIAILVLLLLMLLSKHRWADDRTQLKPTQFLKNQDKHLASLDARIKEQLKRYEEV